VEQQHEQKPPGLVGELEVGLVLDVDPHEGQRHDEYDQQDGRNLLEDHEQQHGGHPTSGVAA
jgi:hypothetical protein